MKIFFLMVLAGLNIWFLLKVIKPTAKAKGLEYEMNWQDIVMIIALSVVPVIEDGSAFALIFAMLLSFVGIYFMMSNYIFDDNLDDYPPNTWALASMSASLGFTALNCFNLANWATIIVTPIVSVSILGTCGYTSYRTFKRCRSKKDDAEDDEEYGVWVDEKLPKPRISGKGWYIAIMLFDILMAIILLSAAYYRTKYNTY